MFIYLTVTSMILGIFPSSPLIAYFGLSAQFEPLIRALKQGHITTFHRVLDEWRPWFARRGLYHILNERCEILLWRNLFRRT